MTRLDEEARDSLFPEFRRDEDAPQTDEQQAEAPARPKKEPVILTVMSKLAHVLAEETRLIREGDFEGFAAIQREKGQLIRQAERLENSQRNLQAVEGLDPESLQAKLESFNGTVEANMRSIGAVKDAVTHVRTAAIRKLEEEKGDGVYSKDGEKKSLHHLPLSGNKVKL
ncbi:hypothetical protein HK107_13860 [Parvularcula sp. ZS-1/3]|uniref:Flagellar protein FlgN n=2 Tax=Parvularcula mediterranea TaxID=2732508 RepID=A0A7Y3RNN5_9PROT|nr:hypothetical protein [Parvularcula mediterranea]